MDYNRLIDETEKRLQKKFSEFEKIAQLNQEKVLNAFISCRISSSHFAGTTGYGYGDSGRDKLCELYAKIFNTQSAIVSPHFASGTHAISTALFGVLRPSGRAISISGMPYDTLKTAIFGEGIGSLKDYGVSFETVPLNADRFDFNAIRAAFTEKPGKYDAVYIQRSAGYEKRESLSIAKIKEAVDFVRKYSDAPIIVDNCYGEFTESREPTDVGADIVVGSLIKNPGGALAPTGGYIAGQAELIKRIGMRLTAPGIGMEIGSYENSYRNFFQGIFLAPHIVCQAKKGGLLISAVMEELGYSVIPPSASENGDIVRIICFNDREKMVRFCQAVQAASPVDSYLTPQPWAMPGYDSEVIMASGSFVQGSSIELSADAPVKSPYSLFIQGGMTYEHTKAALAMCLRTLSL